MRKNNRKRLKKERIDRGNGGADKTRAGADRKTQAIGRWLFQGLTD
ncbi:MAG: hypothetical protein INR73_00500 [Williamsia sp.]|nr:hypothetical protein [Williamsia sp.]